MGFYFSLQLSEDNYIKLNRIANNSGVSLSSALTRVVISFVNNKKNTFEKLKDFRSEFNMTRFCWVAVRESNDLIRKLKKKYNCDFSTLINYMIFYSRAKFVVAREQRSSFNKSLMSLNRRLEKYNKMKENFYKKKRYIQYALDED